MTEQEINTTIRAWEPSIIKDQKHIEEWRTVEFVHRVSMLAEEYGNPNYLIVTDCGFSYSNNNRTRGAKYEIHNKIIKALFDILKTLLESMREIYKPGKGEYIHGGHDYV